MLPLALLGSPAFLSAGAGTAGVSAVELVVQELPSGPRWFLRAQISGAAPKVQLTLAPPALKEARWRTPAPAWLRQLKRDTAPALFVVGGEDPCLGTSAPPKPLAWGEREAPTAKGGALTVKDGRLSAALSRSQVVDWTPWIELVFAQLPQIIPAEVFAQATHPGLRQTLRVWLISDDGRLQLAQPHNMMPASGKVSELALADPDDFVAQVVRATNLRRGGGRPTLVASGERQIDGQPRMVHHLTLEQGPKTRRPLALRRATVPAPLYVRYDIHRLFREKPRCRLTDFWAKTADANLGLLRSYARLTGTSMFPISVAARAAGLWIDPPAAKP